MGIKAEEAVCTLIAYVLFILGGLVMLPYLLFNAWRKALSEIGEWYQSEIIKAIEEKDYDWACFLVHDLDRLK